MRLDQRIVELAQLAERERLAAADRAEERRVRRRAAAEHHAAERLKATGDRAEIRRREDIAVVHDGKAGLAQRGGEGVTVRLAAVHALAVARVDDQLVDRIALEYAHQRLKFRRRGKAQPRLDRHGDRRAGIDVGEKGVKPLRLAQHGRALVLGHHGGGGTSDVEVDLLIAHVGKLARDVQKGLGVVREDLRHKRDRVVVFGKNIAQPGDLEFSLAVGRDKGGVIFVRLREMSVVYPPEHIAGHTLHGGEGQRHYHHHADDNDHRMAKSIENSIDFAAKRQDWQRMIP